MNSLVVGALGIIDFYYVGHDVVLLAQLAGWTGQAPENNPWFAAVALSCVIILWVAHRSLLQRSIEGSTVIVRHGTRRSSKRSTRSGSSSLSEGIRHSPRSKLPPSRRSPW